MRVGHGGAYRSSSSNNFARASLLPPTPSCPSPPPFYPVLPRAPPSLLISLLPPHDCSPACSLSSALCKPLLRRPVHTCVLRTYPSPAHTYTPRRRGSKPLARSPTLRTPHPRPPTHTPTDLACISATRSGSNGELTRRLEARPHHRGRPLRHRPPLPSAQEPRRRVPLATALLDRDDLGPLPPRTLGEDPHPRAAVLPAHARLHGRVQGRPAAGTAALPPRALLPLRQRRQRRRRGRREVRRRLGWPQYVDRGPLTPHRDGGGGASGGLLACLLLCVGLDRDQDSGGGVWDGIGRDTASAIGLHCISGLMSLLAIISWNTNALELFLNPFPCTDMEVDHDARWQ